jgi:hypothetical protein
MARVRVANISKGAFMEHSPVETSNPTLQVPVPRSRFRVGKGLLGGLIGIGICVLCLLPPIFHFVLGPLGPALGGFVGGARVKARGREAGIVGVTIGIGLSAIVSTVFYISGSMVGAGRTPPAMLVAGVGTLVLLYASTLGWAGAWFAGRG